MATFTYVHPGTEDAATGLFTGGTTTTYTGSAVRISGGSDEYARLRALNVLREDALVLGWTPATYTTTLPPLGSTIAWGGVTYTLAAHLKVVDPDGGGVVYARLGCRR